MKVVIYTYIRCRILNLLSVWTFRQEASWTYLVEPRWATGLCFQIVMIFVFVYMCIAEWLCVQGFLLAEHVSKLIKFTSIIQIWLIFQKSYYSLSLPTYDGDYRHIYCFFIEASILTKILAEQYTVYLWIQFRFM